mgnify:FL=1
MEKRKLSLDEIKYVLRFINIDNNIPHIISFSKTKNIIKQLKKQLEQIEIYPDMIDELSKEIERQYYACQIQAGESVGIIAAQAHGEKQTQANLN